MFIYYSVCIVLWHSPYCKVHIILFVHLGFRYFHLLMRDIQKQAVWVCLGPTGAMMYLGAQGPFMYKFQV